jgi:predicted HicB family RNase H-like nuclease
MAYKDKKVAQEVQNNWIKENCDRINLTVPKGDKSRITIAAAAAGQSVNAYIGQAINERIMRESRQEVSFDGEQK